jgi:hypothetical protein
MGGSRHPVSAIEFQLAAPDLDVRWKRHSRRFESGAGYKLDGPRMRIVRSAEFEPSRSSSNGQGSGTARKIAWREFSQDKETKK